jgi:branched-chain amino acid transport system substrate-binding protein
MNWKRRRANYALGIACLTGVAMAATACSSSSASSSDKSGPIKVMVEGQWAATSFEFPEGRDGVLAYTEDINSHGGIGGRKVEAIVCNDQGNPNVAATCARQAESDNVVAIVTPYDNYSTVILPIFQQEGIAFVGNLPVSPADNTNPVSFPTGSLAGYTVGTAKAMVAKGCRTLAFIHYNTPTALIVAASLKQVMQTVGGKVVDFNVNQGAPDYSPVAASIQASGANCAFSILPPSDNQKWLPDQYQRTPKIIIGAALSATTPALLKVLGKSGNGMLLGSGIPAPTDTSFAEVREFQADMAKYYPHSAITAFSLGGWADAKLVYGVFRTMKGPITKTTVLQAMNHITKPATMIFGDYVTTSPNTNPQDARLFNRIAYIYTTKNGQYVLDGPAQNVSKAFQS